MNEKKNGFFLYLIINDDLNTESLKWVEIIENWLFISESLNFSKIISLNLGYCTFFPTISDKLNSIVIETKDLQKYIKLNFFTYNRFEILKFLEFLNFSKNKWEQEILINFKILEKKFFCIERTKSVIGIQIQLILNENGFLIIYNNNNNKLFISFLKIKTITSLFYNNFNGTTFEIVYGKNDQNLILQFETNEIMLECIKLSHILKNYNNNKEMNFEESISNESSEEIFDPFDEEEIF